MSYREGKLCPAILQALLWIHCRCDSLDAIFHPDAPIKGEVIDFLLNAGMIVVDHERPSSGYRTTTMGGAFIRMLESTPFPRPISAFQNPTTGEIIT